MDFSPYGPGIVTVCRVQGFLATIGINYLVPTWSFFRPFFLSPTPPLSLALHHEIAPVFFPYCSSSLRLQEMKKAPL